MFTKTKLIIGLVSVVLVGLGIWLNPYTIEKKSVLKKYETNRFNDSTANAKLAIEPKGKNVQIFPIQQNLDICVQNKPNREAVIAQLTKS